MTLHNYATPLLTILLTRLSGGVDGRNLAMNGKAARQTVARDATARVAGSASAAGVTAWLACDAGATTLAASSAVNAGASREQQSWIASVC